MYGHCHTSNFEGDGKVNDRDSFIHDVNMLLEWHRLHIKNEAFVKKGSIYNPEAKKRSGASAAEAKRKGDIVDAGMHGIHAIKEVLPKLWNVSGTTRTIVRSNFNTRG
jgi:hypothetical protein